MARFCDILFFQVFYILFPDLSHLRRLVGFFKNLQKYFNIFFCHFGLFFYRYFKAWSIQKKLTDNRYCSFLTLFFKIHLESFKIFKLERTNICELFTNIDVIFSEIIYDLMKQRKNIAFSLIDQKLHKKGVSILFDNHFWKPSRMITIFLFNLRNFFHDIFLQV